jgi:CheY-like chemotaxis protein
MRGVLSFGSVVPLNDERRRESLENARGPSPGKLHVLVVDDNPMTLDLTEIWLRAAGHRVTKRTAAVGTAADVIQLHPDVALIDVLMPGLRGDDLARLLKRHPATRGVAVILFYSLPLDELRTMIMTTGALGVIEKTPNQALFMHTFNNLTTKLRSSRHQLEPESTQSPPATSGTFPIESRVPVDAPASSDEERSVRPAAEKRR